MSAPAPRVPVDLPASLQLPDHWLVPQWPAPPGVHALCTARPGGVSLPPYDSCNLGDHVGDDAAAVAANRRRLAVIMQATTASVRPVFLRQVHGDAVLDITDPHMPDGAEADACVSSASALACAIMVADCLPVLLAHTSGKVVAAAHAGWRGLAGEQGQGVLETVFERFAAKVLVSGSYSAIETVANSSHSVTSEFLGSPESAMVAHDTLAWLGPCIGPTAFEVGEEVRDAFCAASPASADCFVPQVGRPGKLLCDLAGLARQRLQALGITRIYGNDSSAPWCTVTQASRFFSHRYGSAHGGASGRFAACIWRD